MSKAELIKNIYRQTHRARQRYHSTSFVMTHQMEWTLTWHSENKQLFQQTLTSNTSHSQFFLEEKPHMYVCPSPCNSHDGIQQTHHLSMVSLEMLTRFFFYIRYSRYVCDLVLAHYWICDTDNLNQYEWCLDIYYFQSWAFLCLYIFWAHL